MASIHPKARIGDANSFGYGVRIGPDVEIGDKNFFGEYVTISGKVVIGHENIVGTGSVFGGTSNHVFRKRFRTTQVLDDDRAIHIGNQNLFGEFVTVHSPVALVTSVGSYVSIGSRTHISHDATIEDYATLSIHCGLGGYVRILFGANVGIGVNIHPRLVVGQYAMIGLGSSLIRHILPGATVVGNPQRYIKPNLIGMERNGLTAICIEELSRHLSGEALELAVLSTETQDILSHFFEILNSDNYIRDVSCIPSSEILRHLRQK